jgi:hypothetical protein
MVMAGAVTAMVALVLAEAVAVTLPCSTAIAGEVTPTMVLTTLETLTTGWPAKWPTTAR